MFFFLLYFQKKRYKCKTCSATRGSLLQIEKHMKAHQDETIMKCRVCKKVSNDYNHCEEHEDSHVIEPRYTCIIVVNKEQGMVCNRKYCLKGSLRTHVQTSYKPLKLEVGNYTKDKNITYESYADFVNRTSKNS